MDAARRVLNRIFELLPHDDGAETDGTVPHEPLEMFATIVPEARIFGDHELEGLVTYIDRYALTLCYEGRIYDVLLRTATRYQPAGSVRLGAFVRIHGTWSDDGFHANQIVRVG